MRYVVVLVFDAAGAWPLILRDDLDPPFGGDYVRYRLVKETEDYREAVRIADDLQRKCSAGETRRRCDSRSADQRSALTRDQAPGGAGYAPDAR